MEWPEEWKVSEAKTEFGEEMVKIEIGDMVVYIPTEGNGWHMMKDKDKRVWVFYGDNKPEVWEHDVIDLPALPHETPDSWITGIYEWDGIEFMKIRQTEALNREKVYIPTTKHPFYILVDYRGNRWKCYSPRRFEPFTGELHDTAD